MKDDTLRQLFYDFGYNFFARHNRRAVLVLCGSTRHKLLFERLQLELTMMDFVVHALPVYSEYDNITLSDDDVEKLILMHNYLIAESDGIVVITGGDEKLGMHTSNEIKLALSLDKPIYYDMRRS